MLATHSSVARQARCGATARRRVLVVGVMAGTLVVAVIVSLAVGAKAVPVGSVIDAFVAFDPADADHLVVRELRLPRTIVALVVGVALGVSGALMQAVTRNPLADPGLLGVNAGASFAVVIAIFAFGVGSTSRLVWFALVGASIASVVVYVLGTLGQGGATSVRLALSGAALSALLFACTRAITLLDEATLDQYRFWAVGSLTGRDGDVVRSIVWFVAVGTAIAIGIARPLDAIALGDAAATGLGVRVGTIRALAGLAIVLLCGAAVAACGPIAFVGLVVPHAVRSLVGGGQRWLVAGSAVAGPLLLLACDTLGRVIARPGEVQAGIVTAVVGGPVLVALVRRGRAVSL